MSIQECCGHTGGPHANVSRVKMGKVPIELSRVMSRFCFTSMHLTGDKTRSKHGKGGYLVMVQFRTAVAPLYTYVP